MSKPGIYQITLKADGRSYIGSAINIKQRWKAHIYSSKSAHTKQVIARAIAKYGADSFEWAVLEHCEVADLLVREQHWLDFIRPFADENNGFNVRKVADSNLGITRSVESREKQSKTMTGIPKTDEHKLHMSEGWHKNRGTEYYHQLSERMKGDNNPSKRPEVAAKISESMTGRTWRHDAVRVAKHIETHTGFKHSDESRANMKVAQQKNKTRSDAAKEKFHLAQRRLYEITSPVGEIFQIYSRELRQYCLDNKLSYANLISTAKTGKSYKKGWIAKLIKDKL